MSEEKGKPDIPMRHQVAAAALLDLMNRDLAWRDHYDLDIFGKLEIPSRIPIDPGKPGSLNPERIRDIISQIQYRNVKIRIDDSPFVLAWGQRDRFFVLVFESHVMDADQPGKWTEIIKRENFKLNEMDETKLLEKIFQCILELECHEAGEFFRFRGEKIFDPHKNPQGFLSFAAKYLSDAARDCSG